jgi:ubiquinone/menaquinone biosynthesis C-methylase UbiE
MGINWTGERLETSIYTRDAIDHLHRYAIVNTYIRGKIVLDIACGEGYGSYLMSDKAALVYGVDIDSNTVSEAKIKYNKPNIKFNVGSTDNIPLEDASIDVIVSFETIEHHDKHERMMLEIKRVLKPSGVLILSTPDKLYYSDNRNFNNKFHIKELYKSEFIQLVSKYFKKYQLLNQMYVNGNSIIKNDLDTKKMTIYTGDFFNVTLIEPELLYLISISSDNDFKKQEASIFDGSKIIKHISDKIAKLIYSSRSYKIGHFVLYPFKWFKQIFK